MLETVGIVLNERESTKKKAAQLLEEELRALNITTSRIEIDSEIENTILETKPRILVLDYLLGDYSTGLDILNKLQVLKPEETPQTIFLTDEPSVSVAVEAMRLGAIHYVELNNPRAIPTVVNAVKTRVFAPPTRNLPGRTTQSSLSDLIAHADSSRKLIQQATAIAHSRCPITVVTGAEGTGKLTLAHAILKERSQCGYIQDIDFSTHDLPLDALLHQQQSTRTDLLLGSNLSLVVRNGQDEDGCFLDAVSSKKNTIWPNADCSELSSFLIVCTSDPDIADAWARLAAAEILVVPALAENRRDDIAPLSHLFTAQTGELLKTKPKSLEPQLISWLSEQDWPYNIKQLKSVITNGLLAANAGTEPIETLLKNFYSLWNEQNAERKTDLLITPLTAVKALELSGFRYHIAAARLGCSPMKLRHIIQSANNQDNN